MLSATATTGQECSSPADGTLRRVGSLRLTTAKVTKLLYTDTPIRLQEAIVAPHSNVLSLPQESRVVPERHRD